MFLVDASHNLLRLCQLGQVVLGRYRS